MVRATVRGAGTAWDTETQGVAMLVSQLREDRECSQDETISLCHIQK